jgi:hypothetical protein
MQGQQPRNLMYTKLSDIIKIRSGIAAPPVCHARVSDWSFKYDLYIINVKLHKEFDIDRCNKFKMLYHLIIFQQLQI